VAPKLSKPKERNKHLLALLPAAKETGRNYVYQLTHSDQAAADLARVTAR
jgi:hypothetical protein